MKLLNKTVEETTVSHFGFSGKRLDELGSDEYTLATVAIDLSSSVSGFKSDLEKALQQIIESLRKSPRAENVLVRVAYFNYDVGEIHGFVNLDDVEKTDYSLNPSGMTALYDGILSSIEATQQYGNKLFDMDYLVNGVTFIVTDGMENHSRVANVDKIKEALGKITKEEKLESLKTVLIGIGGSDVQSYLDDLKNETGLDQFVHIGDATPGKLAKLADFVSKSISSSSQSLGTGGPSKNLTF